MAETGTQLQWGGRFAAAPDPALLAFGSSLESDLFLAPFDVRCSRGHVAALAGGGLLSAADAAALRGALDAVEREIADGSFADFARARAFEDVHGAIDARVRELAESPAGELLHAGRSRNDQVATTLLLYARDRAAQARDVVLAIATELETRAARALRAGTLVAATTHWQPAQPVLLAFWLDAAAQPFVRAASRFIAVQAAASAACPLGSGAVAGSSLPLDRAAAARELGFAMPSRNALDSVGDRDVALDLLHAATRAVAAASRPSEEFVLWTTPAFGYARLGDAAATGSSLMPQKRNPDPFELVRAAAGRASAAYAGALGTTIGIGLSYHRDLQETKALVIAGTEHALAALDAFGRALSQLTFNDDVMTARAGDGYTVATDVADAVIAAGATARAAHRAVGERVLEAEQAGRALEAADAVALGVPDAPVSALASVSAKKTSGSTNPAAVRDALGATTAQIGALAKVPS
ncbi:MAG: argininosuccinate lyase [Candidatus Velthaea sp.]